MSLYVAPRPVERSALDDLFSLQGRVAVVTGAAGPVGRVIADRLAQAGAALMLADFESGAAEMAAVTVAHRYDGCALAAGLDVHDPAAAAALADRTVAELGRLDVWINAPSGPGGLTTAEVAAERLSEAGGGVLVNIDGAGAVDEAALYDVTRTLALMFRRRGVRVAGIAPGLDATPDQVARVALFLAGDAAEGIVGATIPVRGS